MSHLLSTTAPLDVIVKGNSIVPYCHFDLPESDYLVSRRPSQGRGSYTGRIDQGTKIIEFITKLTGTKVNK